LEFGKKEKPTIQEIPQAPNLPAELLKETGIETVEPAIPVKVENNSQNLIINSESQKQEISIPALEGDIELLAKGSVDSSSTWLGNILARIRKIAARKRII